MEMTNEQKTRDLAKKVCGWTWGPDACGRECWLDCEGLPACLAGFSPFTSRDDADQLMGRLTDEQWPKITWHLCQVLNPSGGSWTPIRSILSATPAQISEAIWRSAPKARLCETCGGGGTKWDAGITLGSTCTDCKGTGRAQ